MTTLKIKLKLKPSPVHSAAGSRHQTSLYSYQWDCKSGVPQPPQIPVCEESAIIIKTQAQVIVKESWSLVGDLFTWKYEGKVS